RVEPVPFFGDEPHDELFGDGVDLVAADGAGDDAEEDDLQGEERHEADEADGPPRPSEGEADAEPEEAGEEADVLEDREDMGRGGMPADHDELEVEPEGAREEDGGGDPALGDLFELVGVLFVERLLPGGPPRDECTHPCVSEGRARTEGVRALLPAERNTPA